MEFDVQDNSVLPTLMVYHQRFIRYLIKLRIFEEVNSVIETLTEDQFQTLILFHDINFHFPFLLYQKLRAYMMGKYTSKEELIKQYY